MLPINKNNINKFNIRLLSFFARRVRNIKILDVSNPLLLDSNPALVANFGDKNSEIVFYVIQQQSMGRGLCSLFSSVIFHLKFAEDHNFIPIIDMKNFTTVYSDKKNCINLWEELFEKSTNYSLNEVYLSRNVIFSTSYFPESVPFDISAAPELHYLFKKYFVLNSAYDRYVQEKIAELPLELNECLGVHARGREQRFARGHSFPPTPKQIISNIDFVLNNQNINGIFLVTEDPDILKILKMRYGKKVFYFNLPREKDNIYDFSNEYREFHKLNLAKEVFLETLALSKCKSFIGSVSNVSNFAKFINLGKFEYSNVIKNSINSNLPIISRYKWYLSSRLPDYLGGFSSF